MSTRVFINLPVKDLKASMSFFSSLGYTFNEQFTDENAASMVVSEHIFVMLLTEKYFATFTEKEICDAKKATEVLIALDLPSRDSVQEMISKALAGGATKYKEPQDHGWMYQHSFADLDGHQWEFVYMDASQLPG